MSEEKQNTFQRIAGDKGSKRMLFFIGGIVVLIFALIFFLSGGETADGNESRLREAPNQRDDIIEGEVSENYERALRESDRQRIEQARDEGRSALPSIIGSSVQDEDQVDMSVDNEEEEPSIIRPDVQAQEEVQPVALPEETAEEEPEPANDPRPIIRPRDTTPERPTTTNVRPRQQPTNTGTQQPQEPQLVERPRPQTDEALRSLYAQQMGRIMQRMDRQPGSPTTQYFYQPGASGNAAAGNAAASSYGTAGAERATAAASGGDGNLPAAIMRSRGQASSASGQQGGASMQAAQTRGSSEEQGAAQVGSGGGQAAPFDMPMPGEIIYASMVTRADSDAPGPIVAKILQGDLAGARLLGNFSVANEKLMLEFTTLSVEETMSGKAVNKSYGVSAVAVDTEHVGTGIATSVDRHLVSRIAVKASTSFLSGLGTAISASGQVVNSLGEGQTETQTPERSLETNALIASGEAAKETGNVIDEYLGGKPTTVRVEAGTPLGILFLQ